MRLSAALSGNALEGPIVVPSGQTLSDAMRQDYRETIPDLLASHFSRKLEKTEWKALHMGIARADLLARGRRGARRQLRSMRCTAAIR